MLYAIAVLLFALGWSIVAFRIKKFEHSRIAFSIAFMLGALAAGSYGFMQAHEGLLFEGSTLSSVALFSAGLGIGIFALAIAIQVLVTGPIVRNAERRHGRSTKPQYGTSPEELGLQHTGQH